MTQPVEGAERSPDRHSAVRKGDSTENSGEIAQRIRTRCVESPGVAAGQGLSRLTGRILRSMQDRLPLLTVLQKRWARHEQSSWHRPSALLYLRGFGAYGERLAEPTSIVSPSPLPAAISHTALIRNKEISGTHPWQRQPAAAATAQRAVLPANSAAPVPSASFVSPHTDAGHAASAQPISVQSISAQSISTQSISAQSISTQPISTQSISAPESPSVRGWRSPVVDKQNQVALVTQAQPKKPINRVALMPGRTAASHPVPVAARSALSPVGSRFASTSPTPPATSAETRRGDAPIEHSAEMGASILQRYRQNQLVDMTSLTTSGAATVGRGIMPQPARNRQTVKTALGNLHLTRPPGQAVSVQNRDILEMNSPEKQRNGARADSRRIGTGDNQPTPTHAGLTSGSRGTISRVLVTQRRFATVGRKNVNTADSAAPIIVHASSLLDGMNFGGAALQRAPIDTGQTTPLTTRSLLRSANQASDEGLNNFISTHREAPSSSVNARIDSDSIVNTHSGVLSTHTPTRAAAPRQHLYSGQRTAVGIAARDHTGDARPATEISNPAMAIIKQRMTGTHALRRKGKATDSWSDIVIRSNLPGNTIAVQPASLLSDGFAQAALSADRLAPTRDQVATEGQGPVRTFLPAIQGRGQAASRINADSDMRQPQMARRGLGQTASPTGYSSEWNSEHVRLMPAQEMGSGSPVLMNISPPHVTEAFGQPPATTLPTDKPVRSAVTAEHLAEERPKMSELELERIADKVYVMIEQRLLIERESMGL